MFSNIFNDIFITFYHSSFYITIKMKGGRKMFKLKKEYTVYENKSLRLPKDLIDEVQKLATENEMSFNKVVIQCIEYALEHTEQKNN